MGIFSKDEKIKCEVYENGKLFCTRYCTPKQAKENEQTAKEMGRKRGTTVTIKKC